MNGAIFYSGQYGSTAQYARWIGEATGLPVFDVQDRHADPSQYDFVVLGSSVIVYKLTIRKWLKRHLAQLEGKPIVLFSVSGARGGEKLEGWVANSLPAGLVERVHHVPLGGRLNMSEVSWWTRLILRIGAWKNDNPEERKHELKGFDFTDRSSIDAVTALVRELQAGEAVPAS
jgi:menaquinone-dependent protoporphyrinogen IX oxidase